jgi:hypothetical protein
LQVKKNEKYNILNIIFIYNVLAYIMDTHSEEDYIQIDDVMHRFNVNTYWHIKLNKVKRYIHEYKKLPPCNAQNAKIKNLYKWIKKQERKYKDAKYIFENREFYREWSKFIEENNTYFLSRYDKWIYNLNMVKHYINEHHEMPKKSSNDIEIRKLGSWVEYQKNKFKNNVYNMKYRKIYDIWNQFVHEYKKYFKTQKTKWIEKLDKLKYYIDKYDDIPYYKSENIDELVLYKWMINQMQNYKNVINIMKDPEIHEMWFEFIKEYNDYF